jgi:hypothetical protein
MLLVVIFLLICVTPAAFQWLPLMALYAVPVGVLLWIWRSGTDVDSAGITVRAIAGSRRVSWNDIAGLSPTDRGELRAVLPDGRLLRLPQARLRHLKVIAAASGGHVSADPQNPTPKKGAA